MSDRPVVSVIIPVYNGERFLAEAIQSVMDQTRPPDEIIVVDDGSTDGTAQVVEALASRDCLPIRYAFQENQGPAAARNLGMRLATGTLFAFLDADDLWDVHKQAIQLAQLAAHGEVAMVWGLVQQFEMQDQKRVKRANPWHGPNVGSGLFRREAFERVGPFDPGMRFSEDLDWYLRARALGLVQKVLPDIALWYRFHGDNMWLGRPKCSYTILHALKKHLDRHRRQGESETDSR